MSPAQFRAWVQALHLDLRGAARLLGVAHGTVRNWAAGSALIPYGVEADLIRLNKRIQRAAEQAVVVEVATLRIGDMLAAAVAARATLLAATEGRRMEIGEAPSSWIVEGPGVLELVTQLGKPDPMVWARETLHLDASAAWFVAEPWIVDATELVVATSSGESRYDIVRK